MDPAPEASDELYDLAPEEFVAERDALAKRLRAEGDREGAAAVKELRRPSVLAWALNQTARRHHDEVAELAARVHDAAAAQQEVLAGREADLRGAVHRRQEAVQRVHRLAERILDERGSGGHGSQLAEALQVVASDEGAAAELAVGRLHEPPAPGTADDLADLLSASVASAAPRDRDKSPEAAGPASPSRSGRTSSRSRARRDATPQQDGGEQARQERERLEQQRADELARQRREAMAELANAERAASRADEQLERAEHHLAEAESSVHRLEGELQRAREVAEQREERVGRRREAAETARQRLQEARTRVSRGEERP